MKSIARKIASVSSFPAFSGCGVYMHKTSMDAICLPAELQQYAPLLADMLAPLPDRAAVCYVTIDEKLVSNTTHRRAGVHVDHNWYESLAAHGGGGGGTTGGHNPQPTCPTPGHRVGPDELTGGMLLASTYPACQVWHGEFEGVIGAGGCCQAIDLTGLSTEVMPANEVYYLNPLGIHESLPIRGEVYRQLVRVNFHPDYVPAALF